MLEKLIFYRRFYSYSSPDMKGPFYGDNESYTIFPFRKSTDQNKSFDTREKKLKAKPTAQEPDSKPDIFFPSDTFINFGTKRRLPNNTPQICPRSLIFYSVIKLCLIKSIKKLGGKIALGKIRDDNDNIFPFIFQPFSHFNSSC